MNDCILRKLKINFMNLGDDLWLTTQMILNFAIASPKLKVLETLVKPASKIIWRTFKNTYTQTIFFSFFSSAQRTQTSLQRFDSALRVYVSAQSLSSSCFDDHLTELERNCTINDLTRESQRLRNEITAALPNFSFSYPFFPPFWRKKNPKARYIA